MHSVLQPRGFSIPLAFIGASARHQMSHWDQPDTICSDNSQAAAKQGQLERYRVAAVNCRARMTVTSPCSQQVEWHKSKKTNCFRFYCSGPVCAGSVSWQPSKYPAVVASLVSLSFLSDSVMLFCIEGNLFKAGASSFSHARTISVLNHWTPLEDFQSEHNLSFPITDLERQSCAVHVMSPKLVQICDWKARIWLVFVEQHAHYCNKHGSLMWFFLLAYWKKIFYVS